MGSVGITGGTKIIPSVAGYYGVHGQFTMVANTIVAVEIVRHAGRTDACRRCAMTGSRKHRSRDVASRLARLALAAHHTEHGEARTEESERSWFRDASHRHILDANTWIYETVKARPSTSVVPPTGLAI